MSSLIPFSRAPLPRTPRGQFYFFVLYDTPHDKLRAKLAQRCLEGGLSRVQLSCYVGCVSERRARDLWSSLVELAHSIKSADDEPSHPAARLTMLRLDQAQLWPSLHIESPSAKLTPISEALSPASPSKYLVFSSEFDERGEFPSV